MRFRHLPTFVSVEPANFCQLACPECPVGRRKHGGLAQDDKAMVMAMPLYESLLKQIEGHVHTIQFYFQGEPLLHPQLPEMIRMAHDRGIYTIVSTNAQALTEELANELITSGLSRIIVSMDGLTEESYGAYRQGGSVARVKDGLRWLAQAKQTHRGHTHIELQCLRLRSNEGEWKVFRQMYRQLGADSLTLKTAQFYDFEAGHPLMPSEEKYSRYQRGEDGVFHLKKRPNQSILGKLYPCRRIYMGCVVDVHGRVLPCCFDKEHRQVMGDLTKQSFRACWQSERAQQIRWHVLRSRGFEMCSNCTE